MIKKTCVFFFVMLAHVCSGQKIVEKIKGNWIYSYSFKADTVIIFTEISQSTDPYLAAEYIFEKDTLNNRDAFLKKLEPNFLSTLVCIIPGNLNRFYPLGYELSNSLILRKMEVQLHYQSGLKYKNFRVLKIRKNRMYLKDTRRHIHKDQIYTEFTHVYIRK
jgi:hypothetical protein